jgi:uncharacterized protein (TIGR00299 family) protein
MIAYFDCSSGISGDMILGSLVDAGVSLQRLKKELSRLPVKGYKLEAKKVKRAGFGSTKVDVIIEHRTQNTEHRQKTKTRKWKDVEKIIKGSTLSKEIKAQGLAIFKKLFKAEAKVHGESLQNVHLHELGAVDCIIDIFGALVGLDILGIKKLYASPVNVGGGTVKTEHGILPVPAPATLELLKGVPIYSSGIEHELTTPTGAVIITSLADEFIPIPDMAVSKTGTGAGGRNFRTHPNVLRLFLGESLPLTRGGSEVTVIETNIEDMNPQVYGHVMEMLLKAGALDVYLTQVIMKKGRPGVQLTILCDEKKKDKLAEIIFRETTSIGLRFYTAGREILDREIKTVKTEFGKVRVKVSSLDGNVLKATPEYEDCRKIAEKHGIPLVEVLKLVNDKAG